MLTIALATTALVLTGLAHLIVTTITERRAATEQAAHTRMTRVATQARTALIAGLPATPAPIEDTSTCPWARNFYR